VNLEGRRTKGGALIDTGEGQAGFEDVGEGDGHGARVQDSLGRLCWDVWRGCGLESAVVTFVGWLEV
jgi:hypothetical protein